MSQDSIDLILYKLADLSAKVEELRTDQKTMAARAVCPNPSACALLARDVEQLAEREESREARVRHLETLADQAAGVGLAAKALWAFIGAGGFGVAAVVYQLIFSRLGK